MTAAIRVGAPGAGWDLAAAAFSCHYEVPDMHRCAICRTTIAGPCLIDSEGGAEIHAACLARRLPQDAFVALLAAVALALAPPIVVWAG
jgi:hypothetical protein